MKYCMKAASACSMLSELLESEEDAVSLESVEDVAVDASVLQASVDASVWDAASNSVESSVLVAAELLWPRVS